MRQKLAVDVQIEFVPMPPEQYEAWRYAMQIISGYLLRLKAETEIEKKIDIETQYSQKAADDEYGQLSQQFCGKSADVLVDNSLR